MSGKDSCSVCAFKRLSAKYTLYLIILLKGQVEIFKENPYGSLLSSFFMVIIMTRGM